MKIKFDKGIGNHIPPLKYLVLVFGYAAGTALVAWLVYCMAIDTNVREVLLGWAVFVLGNAAMIVSTLIFEDEGEIDDFEEASRHIFRVFYLVPLPILILAVLIKFLGLVGFFSFISLVVLFLFSIWLNNATADNE